MNLTINISRRNPKTDLFIDGILIPYIEDTFINLIDRRKLIKYKDYFKNNNLGWITYNNKTIIPSPYEILIAGIKNLIVYRYPDKYVITINPNKILPKTSAKLNDICKLINYGTLSISRYPIFTEVFEIISKQVPYLYETFLEE